MEIWHLYLWKLGLAQPMPLVQFCHFQYFSKKTARQLDEVFRKAPTDGAVIFHYGASHIQSEIVVTEARGLLQKELGDGGRGLVFNYTAANTYSSINYKCLKTGDWTYAKSFMTNAPLPLVIFVTSMVALVWGVIFYIFFQLVVINRIGKKGLA